MPWSENKKLILLREYLEKLKKDYNCPQTSLADNNLSRSVPSTGNRRAELLENFFLVEKFLPAIHPKKVCKFQCLDCDISSLQLSGSNLEDFLVIGCKNILEFSGKFVTCLDKSIEHTEVIDTSNDGLLTRISTFHREVKIKRDLKIKLDEFGHNEYRLKAKADGLCLDNVSISESVIFLNSSARGLMAENLNIAGDLIFDSVILDFASLYDFTINDNGSLQILNSLSTDFKIVEAEISTIHKSKNGLVLSRVDFVNCCFGNRGNLAYFHVTYLDRVGFRDCDFTDVEIRQLDQEKFVWDFVNCNLNRSCFKDIRGELVIYGRMPEIEIGQSEISLKLLADNTTMHLEDVILINPEIKANIFSHKAKWINIKLQVDAQSRASLSRCIFEGIDLSDADSAFMVSGTLDLSHTLFRNCNLSGLLFANCILDEVVFENCNLSHCSFAGVKGSIRNLTVKGPKSKLDGVSFSGKFNNLSLIEISEDEISKSDFGNGEFTGGEFNSINFRDWQAENGKFLGVKFSDCHFTECHFKGCCFDAFSNQFTEFHDCDFKQQKVFEDVTFNQVIIEDNNHKNGFQGVKFRNCNIEAEHLYAGKTASEIFSSSSLENCNFRSGLDLSAFPFTQISDFKDITLESCGLGHSVIDCAMVNVKFQGCELSEIKFGSPKRRTELTNLSLLIRNCDKPQHLIFENAKIENVRIFSKYGNQEKLNLYVRFLPDVKIDGLQFEDISLDEFSLENCQGIQNLHFKDVAIESGGIKKGSLQGAKFKNFNGRNFNLIDVKFSEDCLFINSNLHIAKFENTNFFSLPPEAFNIVTVTYSEVSTQIAGDFDKFSNARLKIDHSTFKSCDFTGANLKNFDLSNNRFFQDCNLSGVRDKTVSGCNFTGSSMQANLDSLTFDDCIFAGSFFTPENFGEERRFHQVFFSNCQFDEKTKFTGAVFVGGDRRPELFYACRGIPKLNLEQTTFEQHSFRECCFSGKIHARFKDCILDEVVFDKADIELELINILSNSLTFDSLLIKEKNGLVVDGEQGLAEIEQLVFKNCNIKQIAIEKAAMRTLEFIECEQLNNISFTECSFMEQLRFERGTVYLEENEYLINGLNFTSCYFFQRNNDSASSKSEANIFAFSGNFVPGEINGVSIFYHSESLFSKETRNVLLQLGINPPGQRIGSEWNLRLPFINYAAEIQRLVEGSKIGAARHEEPAKDFAAVLDGFIDFRDHFPQHKYLFSKNAKDEIMAATQKVIDRLQAKKTAMEFEEYQQLKNGWEPLMMIRVDDAELAEINGTISFKTWLAAVFTHHYEFIDWPLQNGGKLFMDFVMCKELLSRIDQNIRYANEKCLGIWARVDQNRVFSLYIGDRGPGMKLSDPVSFVASGIGCLLLEFAAKYTLETYLRCKDGDGKQLTLKANGRFFSNFPEQELGFDEWFGDGTVYVMRFRLF